MFRVLSNAFWDTTKEYFGINTTIARTYNDSVVRLGRVGVFNFLGDPVANRDMANNLAFGA